MAENKKDIVVYILSDRKTYHLYRECPYDKIHFHSSKLKIKFLKI